MVRSLKALNACVKNTGLASQVESMISEQEA